MKHVALHEVASVVRGVSFGKNDVAESPSNGFVPILRAGNIEGDLNVVDDLVWVPECRVSAEQHMRTSDIAICMSSGSQSVVGKTAVLKHDWRGSVGAFCAIIRPDMNQIDPDFLALFLKSETFRAWTRQSSGANIKNIRKTELESFQIPLPLLEEQRRLVDLLSRAEGIIRLRREAQRKAAELVPALFLDMFGDPASNPKGWPSADFGTLGQLDRGKSRHRPRDAQELYGGPYPFIQTGDVTNSGGHITRFTQTYSELGLAQSRLWPAGTLCITIAANIARTGVLDFDACFPDSVVGFTPSQDVTIEYIQHWLGFLQPTLERNAPQAAQKNINLEILRNLPVPVPPIELQRQFAAKANAIRGIAAQQTAALATAQATFDALLHRTFAIS